MTNPTPNKVETIVQVRIAQQALETAIDALRKAAESSETYVDTLEESARELSARANILHGTLHMIERSRMCW